MGIPYTLAGGLHLDFQGGGRLLVLADLLGVLRLRCRDSLFRFLVDPSGQATHEILDRLADGDPGGDRCLGCLGR